MSETELKPLLASIMTNIDKDISEIGFFDKLHKKFGIKPSYLFIGITIITLLLALADIFGQLITTVFGMLYPMLMSFKSIQRGTNDQKKIWLTYWIVFGLLTSIDEMFSFILNIIPGFYAFKLIIYLWLFYPRKSNGAQTIYMFLKPLLSKATQFLNNLPNKDKTA